MDGGTMFVAVLAALAATTVVFLLLTALLSLRRRTQRPALRGVIAAAMIVSFLLGPLTVHAFTAPAIEAEARRGLYIHLSPLIYWAPAFDAVLLLVAARVMLRSRPRVNGTSIGTRRR